MYGTEVRLSESVEIFFTADKKQIIPRWNKTNFVHDYVWIQNKFGSTQRKNGSI